MARYLETLGPAAPIADVMQVLETGDFHPSVEGGLRSFASSPADVHPAQWEEPCPDFAEHAERTRLLEEQHALERRRASQGSPIILNGKSPEELSGAAVRDAIRRLPHRTTQPGLSTIHGDVLGRVWVAEYADPEADVRRWVILNPSLQPVGRVELPVDLEVLAIGSEGLVGRQRDELGVESLTFFATTRFD